MTTAIEARLAWTSSMAVHVDRLVLPPQALNATGALMTAARQLESQDVVGVSPAMWIQPVGQPFRVLPAAEFRLSVAPVPGRFYPMLAFPALSQGPRDQRPARVLDLQGGEMTVDPNHPLANVEAVQTLHRVEDEPVIGRLAQLFDGPGMQSPPPDPAGTYLSDGALTRLDESPDDAFYAAPRLVHHLDAVCRQQVGALYGRHLPPGLRVLDLMSSWTSHLPAGMEELDVTGLGMNRAELACNPALTQSLVQDLNQDVRLPFADHCFDRVLCTASVEYLARPMEVMSEVRRILKPGGLFMVTFSDRWFPPKAIRIWSALHPFERLGMVLWMLQSVGFSDLHTETLRGLRRPDDDPHAGERNHSDPLFAVWGAA